MAKKFYNKKNTIKKSTKEVPVCARCLCTPKDSDMTEFMYFWVCNEGSIPHQELFCINCITDGQKVMGNPYSKPRGRPKGSKNTKKEE